jgi:type II secretory pathway pseudopilin PulG
MLYNIGGNRLETRVRSLAAGSTRPCQLRQGSGCVHRSRGFTLIDVLVTLGVVAILISLLLPSLGRVRETAHQVICRSNVRQIGIGIAMYAEDNVDRLINSVNIAPDGNTSTGRPWDTAALRLTVQPGNIPGRWDGLGRLYDLEYLPAPKLFYCPSHHGRNSYQDFENEWAARSPAAIYGNFQYRGRGPVAFQPSGGGRQSIFLSEISPNSAIVADSMRSQADFNHRIGANVLRANNSVDWYSDSGGRFIQLLPREGENPLTSVFEDLWQNLDDGG